MAAASIIWINAFPGTGKLTVAKALGTLSSKLVVIDNYKKKKSSPAPSCGLLKYSVRLLEPSFWP